MLEIEDRKETVGAREAELRLFFSTAGGGGTVGGGGGS